MAKSAGMKKSDLDNTILPGYNTRIGDEGKSSAKRFSKRTGEGGSPAKVFV